MANMEYLYDSETSADDLDNHSEHDSDDYMTDSDVYDDDLDIEPVASSWARVYPPEGIDCGSDLAFTQRNVGPLGIPNRNSQPIEYFSLFITDDIIDILVRETNIYANRCLASKEEWIREHTRSKYRIWKPVTHERMKKFLALSLLMGLIKVQDIKDFWSTFRSTRIPFFGETMPRDEYLLNSRFLHLNNTLNKPRGDPQYDPWFRVRPLLDSCNKLFKDHYNLQQTISLDESMIGMRNRCAFIQYMPNKRHCRYGIKKFELCEASSGYVYHIDLYSGRDFYATGSQQGFTHTVVMNIMEKSKVLNKGYHLITDNFYTKIPLAEALLIQKTSLTGTIKINSKFLPQILVKQKLSTGETVYVRKGKLLTCGFKEKATRKPVYLLTTYAHAENVTLQTRHGEKIKPKVINDCSVGMGGVDLSDKKLFWGGL
ncbi:piggyBac transposable element-derived protein 4-like [Palaemon carinicauda]|uniref:piggyBac transposable element-derived protein 4-like n=1 Tax=Palaemon carinicauda TaxID=392227 RepID=UPI0035B62FF3